MRRIIVAFVALLTLVSVLVFQNCSKSKNANSVVTDLDDDGTTDSKVLSEIRYYSGGGFPGPNGPMFTDFTVQFFNSKSAVLKKKVPVVDPKSPACDLTKNISETEIANILSILNSVLYTTKGKSDVTRVDGGETFIEIKYKNSSEVLKLYIDAMEAPEGVYEIVENGDELNDYLVDLYEGNDYVESCLTIDWKQVSALRYFRGGWYPAPGQKNWSHDYVLNLSSGALKGKVDDPLCGATRTVSASELNAMKSIISASVITKKSQGEAMMADGVIETVELTYATEVKKVHLHRPMASYKDLVFATPQDISNVMKAVVDNHDLAVFCQ